MLPVFAAFSFPTKPIHPSIAVIVVISVVGMALVVCSDTATVCVVFGQCRFGLL